MRSAFSIMGWLAIAATSLAQGAIYGYDLHGQPIGQLLTPGSQAVVLIFISTDCPISNRYAPEIQRLQKEFAARQVAFWLVYPNANETVAGVLQHESAFGLAGNTLLRPSPELMAETRASITPEAAVAVLNGSAFRTVYTGRIDDHYVDIGRERLKATRHDLEDAVEAVLAHRPVAAAGGPPQRRPRWPDASAQR